MDFFQQQINREMGKQVRKKRKALKLTQADLQIEIMEQYKTALKEKAVCESVRLSDEELERYFDKCLEDGLEKNADKKAIFASLDETLREKLKLLGIDGLCSPIALSTISYYENGERAIPAYYCQLLEKIAKYSGCAK